MQTGSNIKMLPPVFLFVMPLLDKWSPRII